MGASPDLREDHDDGSGKDSTFTKCVCAARVELIDGNRLARLTTENGLGVSTTSTHESRKVDSGHPLAEPQVQVRREARLRVPHHGVPADDDVPDAFF